MSIGHYFCGSSRWRRRESMSMDQCSRKSDRNLKNCLKCRRMSSFQEMGGCHHFVRLTRYCRDTHLSSTRFGCDQMNLRFESSKGCVTCDMLRIGSLCVTTDVRFLCIAFHDHKRE